MNNKIYKGYDFTSENKYVSYYYCGYLCLAWDKKMIFLNPKTGKIVQELTSEIIGKKLNGLDTYRDALIGVEVKE